MPLQEWPPQKVALNTPGSPSRDQAQPKADRDDAPSNNSSNKQENIPTNPGGISSMLKNTTETGDIDIYSGRAYRPRAYHHANTPGQHIRTRRSDLGLFRATQRQAQYQHVQAPYGHPEEGLTPALRRDQFQNFSRPFRPRNLNADENVLRSDIAAQRRHLPELHLNSRAPGSLSSRSGNKCVSRSKSTAAHRSQATHASPSPPSPPLTLEEPLHSPLERPTRPGHTAGESSWTVHRPIPRRYLPTSAGFREVLDMTLLREVPDIPYSGPNSFQKFDSTSSMLVNTGEGEDIGRTNENHSTEKTSSPQYYDYSEEFETDKSNAMPLLPPSPLEHLEQMIHADDRQTLDGGCKSDQLDAAISQQEVKLELQPGTSPAILDEMLPGNHLENVSLAELTHKREPILDVASPSEVQSAELLATGDCQTLGSPNLVQSSLDSLESPRNHKEAILEGHEECNVWEGNSEKQRAEDPRPAAMVTTGIEENGVPSNEALVRRNGERYRNIRYPVEAADPRGNNHRMRGMHRRRANYTSDFGNASSRITGSETSSPINKTPISSNRKEDLGRSSRADYENNRTQSSKSTNSDDRGSGDQNISLSSSSGSEEFQVPEFSLKDTPSHTGSWSRQEPVSPESMESSLLSHGVTAFPEFKDLHLPHNDLMAPLSNPVFEPQSFSFSDSGTPAPISQEFSKSDKADGQADKVSTSKESHLPVMPPTLDVLPATAILEKTKLDKPLVAEDKSSTNPPQEVISTNTAKPIVRVKDLDVLPWEADFEPEVRNGLHFVRPGSRPDTSSTSETDMARTLKLKQSFPWLVGGLPSLPGTSSTSPTPPPAANAGLQINPKHAQVPSRLDQSSLHEARDNAEDAVVVSSRFGCIPTMRRLKIKTRPAYFWADSSVRESLEPVPRFKVKSVTKVEKREPIEPGVDPDDNEAGHRPTCWLFHRNYTRASLPEPPLDNEHARVPFAQTADPGRRLRDWVHRLANHEEGTDERPLPGTSEHGESQSAFSDDSSVDDGPRRGIRAMITSGFKSMATGAGDMPRIRQSLDEARRAFTGEDVDTGESRSILVRAAQTARRQAFRLKGKLRGKSFSKPSMADVQEEEGH